MSWTPRPSNWLSLLASCVLVASSLSTALPQASPDHRYDKRQTSPFSPLVNFQVSEPILTPVGNANQYGCIHSQLLMEHDFAFSYGKPFVGSYTPPPCSFNRVTMTLTVTSKGRQFDRLGLMYLGDIEVFRTSTAEPTTNGIIWTYVKEMEQYEALWKTDQKIIFDLGNLIDNTYTGIFSTTLTAIFFTAPNTRPTADQILPISAEASGRDAPSAFSLPSDAALVNHRIPQNVERAVVSLSACGQATEEFWYTNVLSSEVNTFADEIGTLYGYSPFREVQLLIDGQLTGVSWPFPIIFTGGIAPGLWRPIAGIDAFDLREHEIDITPWLPVLCDGASHSFEIRVAGIKDDGHGDASLSETVGSSWIVTGKIFLFLGPEGSITSGSPPKVDVSPPKLETASTITTNSTGANETLTYSTSATRSISITSEIKTSNGSSTSASWVQHLTYTNLNVLSSQGFTQYTKQSTTGTDRSSSRYQNDYSYPLTVNSTVSISDNGDFGIDASLSRGLEFAVNGPAVFPSKVQAFNHTAFGPATLFTLSGRQQPVPLSTSPLPFFSGAWTTTTQTGEAHYLSAGSRSYSFGITSQHFIFTGLEGTIGAGTNLELYKRDVRAVNATVVSDVEALVGRRVNASPLSGAAPGLVAQQDVGVGSVRELLGRGPGRSKDVLVMASGRTEERTTA